MQMQIIETPTYDIDEPMLDLGIEELDDMTAPGFWEWAAGIGAGTIIGGGALYLGVAAAT